jgi:hypothetical protein
VRDQSRWVWLIFQRNVLFVRDDVGCAGERIIVSCIVPPACCLHPTAVPTDPDRLWVAERVVRGHRVHDSVG